jgi:pyrimidine-nucleoside phosphorylase
VTFDLSDFPNAADKHSTGGVGDKTTLVVAPLVAAMGIPVIKFSGRALDFTGGTLDKLESIPGYKTKLSHDRIIKQANKIGIVVAGASHDMVPADKILYSLRDVTSTVDSIPLIAASVMSKKIAGGAKNIVLDVKFGNGAFMENYDDAHELASVMCSIGRHSGRNMSAILSSMDIPLGNYVGNSLEVIEAIETLKGKGPADLTELSLALASRLVMLAKNENDSSKFTKQLADLISDGSALEKLRSLIKAQKGDVSVIDDYSLFPHAKYEYPFGAEKSGYISQMYAKEIGILVRTLGGGRFRKDDVIDQSVGVQILKKPGEPVKKGEKIINIFYSNPSQVEIIKSSLKKCISISDKKLKIEPLIRGIL